MAYLFILLAKMAEIDTVPLPKSRKAITFPMARPQYPKYTKCTRAELIQPEDHPVRIQVKIETYHHKKQLNNITMSKNLL